MAVGTDETAAVAGPDHPAILVGLIAALHTIELVVRPRWVVWSQDTTAALVEADVRVAAAWDVAAVHRLLSGGWRAEPARPWAAAHGLAIDGLPAVGPPDLFSQTEHDDSEEQSRSGCEPPAALRGPLAARGRRSASRSRACSNATSGAPRGWQGRSARSPAN